MLNAKEADLSLLQGTLVIIQKILNDGTDVIEQKSQYKLDVNDGGGPVTDSVVKSREFLPGTPASVCYAYRE